ncbi:hypothetical protein RIF29_21943 [Crotalaria pallida]|uniref:Uncharacterized protein n=1 Tax=Crotalaria pallida TaxID=3830 RepID=A0AAN9F685_CROPI
MQQNVQGNTSGNEEVNIGGNVQPIDQPVIPANVQANVAPHFDIESPRLLFLSNHSLTSLPPSFSLSPRRRRTWLTPSHGSYLFPVAFFSLLLIVPVSNGLPPLFLIPAATGRHEPAQSSTAKGQEQRIAYGGPLASRETNAIKRNIWLQNQELSVAFLKRFQSVVDQKVLVKYLKGLHHWMQIGVFMTLQENAYVMVPHPRYHRTLMKKNPRNQVQVMRFTKGNICKEF